MLIGLGRIYSAYIKAVDRNVQNSAWGDVSKTGDLLHEFSSGFVVTRSESELNDCWNLETAWLHDVAFSPSGDHLAWVSHNATIFAVSSSDPSR